MRVSCGVLVVMISTTVDGVCDSEEVEPRLLLVNFPAHASHAVRSGA
jgi:hypothetical protein